MFLCPWYVKETGRVCGTKQEMKFLAARKHKLTCGISKISESFAKFTVKSYTESARGDLSVTCGRRGLRGVKSYQTRQQES